MKEIIVLIENCKVIQAFDNYSIAYRYAASNLNYDKVYRTFKREFEKEENLILKGKEFVVTNLAKK